MRRYPIALAALAASLLVTADPASAAQCRNSAGKFIACPAAASTQRCRAANGAFVKCSTPGAKPVAAKTGTMTNTTAVVKAKPAKPAKP